MARLVRFDRDHENILLWSRNRISLEPAFHSPSIMRICLGRGLLSDCRCWSGLVLDRSTILIPDQRVIAIDLLGLPVIGVDADVGMEDLGAPDHSGTVR